MKVWKAALVTACGLFASPGQATVTFTDLSLRASAYTQASVYDHCDTNPDCLTIISDAKNSSLTKDGDIQYGSSFSTSATANAANDAASITASVTENAVFNSNSFSVNYLLSASREVSEGVSLFDAPIGYAGIGFTLTSTEAFSLSTKSDFSSVGNIRPDFGEWALVTISPLSGEMPLSFDLRQADRIDTFQAGTYGFQFYRFIDADSEIGNQTGTIDDRFTFSISSVPEPASWALLIGGIGISGGALRRRRGNVTTTLRFA